MSEPTCCGASGGVVGLISLLRRMAPVFREVLAMPLKLLMKFMKPGLSPSFPRACWIFSRASGGRASRAFICLLFLTIFSSFKVWRLGLVWLFLTSNLIDCGFEFSMFLRGIWDD